MDPHPPPTQKARPPSTHGLLPFVQESCLAAGLSHHELQRRSGIALTTIRRLRHGNGAAEIMTLERLLSSLGVQLLAKRDDQWLALQLSESKVYPQLGKNLKAVRTSAHSLLEVVQMVAKAHSICVNALHRHTGISYAVINRIMNSNYMRVITPCETLLAALNLSLLAVTAHGDTIMIHSKAPDRLRGSARQANYRAAVRRWRQAQPLAHPTGRRSQISKSDIFTLRYSKGLSCREIAEIAHISTERVRQVLRTLNRAKTNPSRSGIDSNTDI
jgi:uncharacterized protein YerC/DNA-binding CsgD family transcriptional regulator